MPRRRSWLILPAKLGHRMQRWVQRSTTRTWRSRRLVDAHKELLEAQKSSVKELPAVVRPGLGSSAAGSTIPAAFQTGPDQPTAPVFQGSPSWERFLGRISSGPLSLHKQGVVPPVGPMKTGPLPPWWSHEQWSCAASWRIERGAPLTPGNPMGGLPAASR